MVHIISSVTALEKALRTGFEYERKSQVLDPQIYYCSSNRPIASHYNITRH